MPNGLTQPYDWVHKADLRPDDGHDPDCTAVDETVDPTQ